MNRVLTVALLAVPLAALVAQLAFDAPWWTRDQRATRLLEAGDAAGAAELFEDPSWRALALHRTGEFERAADVLTAVQGPDAAYNRGNALVFLGRYEEAVSSYDRALELRPGWSEAEENREIARLRIRTEVATGEATELGADEIVFDDTKGQQGDSVEVTGGEELSGDALRALWLRNVQTEPADFLKVKFAYQRATAAEEDE